MPIFLSKPHREIGEYIKKLPAHLEGFGSGTYRYEMRVERPPGTRVEVASNSSIDRDRR